MLASTLWPVQSEREQARGLAQEARDALAEPSESESEDEESAAALVEVEQWLRRHRVP